MVMDTGAMHVAMVNFLRFCLSNGNDLTFEIEIISRKRGIKIHVNSFVIYFEDFSSQLITLVIFHGNHISHLEDVLVFLSFFLKSRLGDDHLPTFIVVSVAVLKVDEHIKLLPYFLPGNHLFQCRKNVARPEKEIKRFLFGYRLSPLFPVLPIIYMQLIRYCYYFVLFYFHCSNGYGQARAAWRCRQS